MGTIELGALQVLLTLRDNLSGPLMMLQRRVMSTAYNMRQAGLAISSAITLPIVGMFAATAAAAIGFERSFTGVLKTVKEATTDLGGLSKAGGVLRRSLLDMSSLLPLSVTELTNIASVVGQLGVGIAEIPSYVDAVARMGIAFQGLNTENIALSVAQFLQVTGEKGQEAPHRFAAAVTELGNTLATQEKPIIDYAKRLAGISNVSRIAAPDILAIGGAMAASGVRAEAGATAMQRIIVMMERAVQTGAGLKALAGVSGMAAEEFQSKWKAGEGGTVILELMKGIERAGDQSIPVLDELGLNNQRTIRSILSLVGSIDVLESAMGASRSEWESMNAHVRESDIFIAALHNQFILLWNDLKRLAIELGVTLLPLMQSFVTVMRTNIIPVLGQFVEAFVSAPVSIQTTTFAVLGLMAALGPLLIMASQLAMALSPAILLSGRGGAFAAAAAASKKVGVGKAGVSGDPWKAAFAAEKAALFAAGSARSEAASQTAGVASKNIASAHSTATAVTASASTQILATNRMKVARAALEKLEIRAADSSVFAAKSSGAVKAALGAEQIARETHMARVLQVGAAQQAASLLSVGGIHAEQAQKSTLVTRAVTAAKIQASQDNLNAVKTLSLAETDAIVRKQAGLNVQTAMTAEMAASQRIVSAETATRQAREQQRMAHLAASRSAAMVVEKRALVGALEGQQKVTAAASQSQKVAAKAAAANAVAAQTANKATAATARMGAGAAAAFKGAATGTAAWISRLGLAIAPLALILGKIIAIGVAIDLALKVGKELYALTLSPDSGVNNMERQIANLDSILNRSQLRADKAYMRGDMDQYAEQAAITARRGEQRARIQEQLDFIQTGPPEGATVDPLAEIARRLQEFMDITGLSELEKAAERYEKFRRAVVGEPTEEAKEQHSFLMRIIEDIGSEGVASNFARVEAAIKALGDAFVDTAAAAVLLKEAQLQTVPFAPGVGSPSSVAFDKYTTPARPPDFGSWAPPSVTGWLRPGAAPASPQVPDQSWQQGDWASKQLTKQVNDFKKSMQDTTEEVDIHGSIIHGVTTGLREFARVVGGLRGELMEFGSQIGGGLATGLSGGGWSDLLSGGISGAINLGVGALVNVFTRRAREQEAAEERARTAAEAAEAAREKRAEFFGLQGPDKDLNQRMAYFLTATLEELKSGWLNVANTILEAFAAGLLDPGGQYGGGLSGSRQWDAMAERAGLTFSDTISGVMNRANIPGFGSIDSFSINPPTSDVPSTGQEEYIRRFLESYDKIQSGVGQGNVPSQEDYDSLRGIGDSANIDYEFSLPPKEQIDSLRRLLSEIDRVSDLADLANVDYSGSIPTSSQITAIGDFLDEYDAVRAAMDDGRRPALGFLKPLADAAGIDYDGILPSEEQVGRLRDLVDEYSPVVGMIEELRTAMGELALLQGAFDSFQSLLDAVSSGGALSIRDYASALREAAAAGAELSEYQRLLATDIDAIHKAAEKFGLSLADVGGATEKSHVAQQLFEWAQQFQILNDAMGDTGAILDAMSETARNAMIDLITESATAGIKIPANLQGFVLSLINSKHLTEDQRLALEGLGEEDFATPIEAQLTTMLETLGTSIDTVTTSIQGLIVTLQQAFNLSGEVVSPGVEDQTSEFILEARFVVAPTPTEWLSAAKTYLTDNPLTAAVDPLSPLLIPDWRTAGQTHLTDFPFISTVTAPPYVMPVWRTTEQSHLTDHPFYTAVTPPPYVMPIWRTFEQTYLTDNPFVSVVTPPPYVMPVWRTFEQTFLTNNPFTTLVTLPSLTPFIVWRTSAQTYFNSNPLSVKVTTTGGVTRPVPPVFRTSGDTSTGGNVYIDGERAGRILAPHLRGPLAEENELLS